MTRDGSATSCREGVKRKREHLCHSQIGELPPALLRKLVEPTAFFFLTGDQDAGLEVADEQLLEQLQVHVDAQGTR
jgi:hypothetical protein